LVTAAGQAALQHFPQNALNKFIGRLFVKVFEVTFNPEFEQGKDCGAVISRSLNCLNPLTKLMLSCLNLLIMAAADRLHVRGKSLIGILDWWDGDTHTLMAEGGLSYSR
jgi:hypothetical protein